MSISDNIIIMNGGVVEQMGTPQETYYYPKSAFVADFIGEANFLKGKVLGQDLVSVEGVEIGCKTGELEKGSECKMVLRPEGATLADEGVVPCKVVYSCFMGSYQNYHVMVGDTLVKLEEYNPRNKKIYQVGDNAYLKFEHDTVFVL